MAGSPASSSVLGLVVDVGGGPVRGGFLPLEPGLTVLYGLNGAGKTRLLRTLASALADHGPGSHADWDLVYRVAPGSFIPPWISEYMTHWATSADVEHSDGRMEVDVGYEELAYRAAWLSLEDHGRIWTNTDLGPLVDREELAAAIASQGLFFISEGGPKRSEVKLACRPTDEHPVIETAIRKARRAEIAAAEVERDYSEIGQDLFQHAYSELYGAELPPEHVFDYRPAFYGLWHSGVTVDPAHVAIVISDATAKPVATDFFQKLWWQGTKFVKKSGKLNDTGEMLVAIATSLAQSLLDEVLLDAPKLVLDIGDATDWFSGRPPAWKGSGYRLEELSEAESRWCRLAVEVATHMVLGGVASDHGRAGPFDLPLCIIIDEPEAHLHRSAEAHAARGLAKWASRLGGYVVVASHSPELLDMPEAHLLEVAPDAHFDAHTVRPLTHPTRASMESLGLLPSDLLRRQRGFLLVEGLHDEIVVRGLLGDELETGRVEILPLRGAKQLPSTVDSQFIFEFTDAHVIVMLDALDAGRVSRVWEETKRLAKTRGNATAGQYLREELKGNQAELKWMREFLSKAVEAGLVERLTPFGLTALDIIEYLPVATLVRGSTGSWTDLRKEWVESGKAGDFKEWLRSTKGANFSPAQLQAAVDSLDSLPEELTRLGDLILNLPLRTRSVSTSDGDR